ncbi:MAG TPA: DNA translocase FtsK, partial [Gaiellaceae bacterium]|nr:DNA translocase FtsK [Gaiellaceae bacterium]
MPRRKRKTKLRPKLPSRVKKTRTKRGARARQQHPELWGLGAVALGLFLGAVLYFGWNGGYVGGWLGDGLDRLVGNAKYVVPVALAALGALVVTKSELVDVRPFRTGLALLGFGLMITLGKDQGGYLGQLLGGAVGVAIAATGSLLLGVFLMLVGSLLLSGASLGAILRRSGRSIHVAARKARGRRGAGGTAGTRYRDETVTATLPEVVHTSPVDAVSAFPDVVGDIVPPPHAGAQPGPMQTEPRALLEEEPTVFDEVTAEHAEYKLPDAGVLRISPERDDNSGEAAARVAELLVQTLAHFGVEATVIGQISGPRVTRYELKLAPGTKVAKVAALKDDLSYALATTEIRILAPIPGKQAVGVELPNLSPNLVTLGDIYEPLPATASPVSVWLGKDISGAAVWTDLARMPHLLIAGTTGSGKSGCLNALLTSVLLRATPDDVRLILIDPKRIELSHFEAVPHLLTPVVSSPKEAAAVLANVVTEMERRYERLSSVRARNLNEANRAFRQRGESTMPYLLVVIDELADLMMVAPQAVEDAVIRLAQKSRAVGI